MANERWEAAMEVVDDDDNPKTFKQVHQRFLDKGIRGHKKSGRVDKKCARIYKRKAEEK
jgi:hypothetical protein